MSGSRAKQLRREARAKAMDGSVIINKEYKKLKKLLHDPSYVPGKAFSNKTFPGRKFSGQHVKIRKMYGYSAGVQNHSL